MKNNPIVFILLLSAACTAPSADKLSTAASTDSAGVIASTSEPETKAAADIKIGDSLRVSPLSITHHYTGIIGGKYKLLMNLYFNENNITGSYRYFTQSDFLELKGTLDQVTNHFNLEESLYDYKKNGSNVTGYFEGEKTGNKVKGTWFNNDRTKSFAFELATDEQLWKGWTFADNSTKEEDRYSLDKIYVMNDRGEQHQVLDGFSSSNLFKNTLYLEDLNFDGHLDVSIPEFDGATNIPMFYWLYDPGSELFIRNNELEQITSATVDLQRREIVSYWKSSAMAYGTDHYVLQEGHYYLIQREEFDYEKSSKPVITRYKIVNGKSVPE